MNEAYRFCAVSFRAAAASVRASSKLAGSLFSWDTLYESNDERYASSPPEVAYGSVPFM
jgi:hypothetical protein